MWSYPGADLKTVDDVEAMGSQAKMFGYAVGETAYTRTMACLAVLGSEPTIIPPTDVEEYVLLIRGDVDFMLASKAMMWPYYESGDAIPIMRFTHERSPDLPDVPCITDIGWDVPVGLTYSRYLIVTSPDTPADRVTILANAIEDSLDTQPVLDFCGGRMLGIEFKGPEFSAGFIDENLDLARRFPDYFLGE
jgi:tripartite-type tricarboxylate transporter receptor subunit TctC